MKLTPVLTYSDVKARQERNQARADAMKIAMGSKYACHPANAPRRGAAVPPVLTVASVARVLANWRNPAPLICRLDAARSRPAPTHDA